MEFAHSKYNCKFSIPERPTVRQQLAYYSAISSADMLYKFWLGARAIVEKWDCDILPDMNIDLDTIYNPSQAEIIIWAGIEVSKHMSALEDVPKNS